MTTITPLRPQLSPHNVNVLESARTLIGQGLAVREVWPLSKRPADLRTDGEKLEKPSYNDAPTTDIENLAERLERATQRGQDMNLAIYLRPTDRLIVVDTDTAEARTKFAELLGNPPTPTVLTPGVHDGHRWVHRDGAHFYYLLPEGFSKDGFSATEVFVGSNGNRANAVEVKIHSTNVLTLPSVRPEGPYRLVNSLPFPEAPQRLLEALETRRDLRSATRDSQHQLAEYAAFDDWNKDVFWDELLTEDGWAAAGTYDACGCAVYSRPGYRNGERSATAHEVDCLVTNSQILWAWSETASLRVNSVIDRRHDGRRMVHKYEMWREIHYPHDHLAAWINSGLAALVKQQRDDVLPDESLGQCDSFSQGSQYQRETKSDRVKSDQSVPSHRPTTKTDFMFIDMDTLNHEKELLRSFVNKNRPTARFICDTAFEQHYLPGMRLVADASEFHGHRINDDTPVALRTFVDWCKASLQRSWDGSLWLSEAHLWATLARSISEARVGRLSSLLGEVPAVTFFDTVLDECASADLQYENVLIECQIDPEYYEWPVWAGRIREDREFLEREVRKRWNLSSE